MKSNESPFCSNTVRNFAGGGAFAAHGKHEKSKNVSPDFLVRVLSNSFPRFDTPLKQPDIRRIGLVYNPDTFQPPDVSEQHPENPHYRPLVEYKLDVKQ